MLTQYTPPVLSGVTNSSTVYAYNLDRNLTKVTRPDGQVIDYAYDMDGRLATMTTAAGVRSFGYAAGHLSSLSDTTDGVSLAYTFDGPLPKSVAWSGGLTGSVGWEYNADFRARREFVTGAQPGVADAYFGYDNDGLLTCASPSSCAPPGGDALVLNRSPSNGRLESTSFNAIASLLTYNLYGELASEVVKFDNNVTLMTESYGTLSEPRDELGRILRKDEQMAGSSETGSTYTYDQVGRLKTESLDGSLTTYNYDANGNRLSSVTSAGTTTGTYDEQDRLLTYGTLNYSYTANGDLQSKTDSSTNQTTSYQYDAFGNLKRVDLPNGDVIEYLVDGENRRVAKKKNGSFVKRWIYRDRLHPVEELDGAGNQLTRFVYATGKNSPDFMVQAGVAYRIISDQLGSPRLVVGATNGVVAQRMRHDAFGNVLEDTSPAFTPFGFAGGLYDSDTGLVLFGARDYDPMVGRWTSRDPIRFKGGQSNLYVYVNNDPVNRVDPNGLESPVDALLGPYFAAQDASSSAEQFFHQPFGGVDGPGDAYRHCVASCNITQRYGPELPALLGWLHENLPWDSDDDPAATAMDTSNNACGRDFGNDPHTDCSLRCYGAAVGGQLITIP